MNISYSYSDKTPSTVARRAFSLSSINRAPLINSVKRGTMRASHSEPNCILVWATESSFSRQRGSPSGVEPSEGAESTGRTLVATVLRIVKVRNPCQRRRRDCRDSGFAASRRRLSSEEAEVGRETGGGRKSSDELNESKRGRQARCRMKLKTS